jgi:hypothetical protein
MTLELTFQGPSGPSERGRHGPERGADRAVLLAHGAGSDMHAATLTVVADALAAAGVPSLRFNYPYRTAGKNAPDRAPVLEAATREAIEVLAQRSGLPPERLVLGGRSMGGRYCSMVAPDTGALGVLLLGYPLHPPGKPERLRVEHFPRLSMPVLFVSGTRDSLAGRDELEREVKAIPGEVAFHWLEASDHGFKPLKASGITQDEAVAEAAAVSVSWVTALP